MEKLAVTFEPGDDGRRAIAGELDGVAEAVYLRDMEAAERRDALAGAGAMLAHNTDREVDDTEVALVDGLRLLQFVSAGVDFVRLDRFSGSLPIAANRGAYAEPMAEHALAMTLAACKRLLVEHANLARGEFNQFAPNRMLSSMTAGILGFGGIGVATARLLRALAVPVHAINRRGESDEPVEWMGTPDDLDAMLAAVDVLVLCLPLTPRSEGMLGERELGLMKPDAILVNLARGEIVDEDALYAHLQDNPAFTACIDAWWIEPVRHGEFRMKHPFLDLPNVIASPHNSASGGIGGNLPLVRAAANCRRALRGEPPLNLLDAEERAPRDS